MVKKGEKKEQTKNKKHLNDLEGKEEMKNGEPQE